jgi:hypothetical protein
VKYLARKNTKKKIVIPKYLSRRLNERFAHHCYPMQE